MSDASAEETQFVVLRHEGIAAPHFDLMIESSPGSKLTTWRSKEWPIERQTELTRIGEHRREYLDFEGDLSGNRGRVRRVASGICRVEKTGAGQPAVLIILFRGGESAALRLTHVQQDRWLAEPAEPRRGLSGGL
jgi:hypothetical protein